MAYFSEAEDLIPDSIPGIGFIDDAIMLELVLQELRQEIEAYEDFCHFHATREKVRGENEDEATQEGWLKDRRAQLHSRIRRRMRSTGGSRRPFSLW